MKSNHIILGLMASVLSLPLALAQVEVVATGQVGVGTSTPIGKMEIIKDSLYNDVDTSALNLSTASTPNSQMRMGFDLTADGAFIQSVRTGVTVKPLFLNAMGGSVGIGTTTPGAKLEVYDSTAASGVISKWTRNSKSLEIYTGSMIDMMIGTPTNSSLGFYTNNSDPFLILDTSSRVGIGTTSPQAGLDVYNGIHIHGNPNYATTGAGLELLKISDSLGTISMINGPDRSERELRFYGTPISFYQSGGERFRVASGGNVGIGTSTPGYKLEVAGSVRATSFISNTTTYADFVFDEGYRLPSLSEVETHIKEQGHLPGIPSEAEAREQGIDLAAMQVALLQKIEELTLHQIAQEKRLNEQSARLAQLESENATLRATRQP